MITLTCPKCRQGTSDAALDAGECPACGFPLDGPVVLDSPSRRRHPARLLLGAGVLVAAFGVAGYVYFGRIIPPAIEVADALDPGPPSPINTPVAPLPHVPKAPAPEPAPARPTRPNDVKDPVPMPVDFAPKKVGPRAIGVVMKIDPRIAPTRDFDHPDDTAALPDLNSGDRVTLTGKVRVLRIGSVNGRGAIDASGLVAEEIVITGDLNGEAVVALNAPAGKVTIGGHVGGASKLTVVAPGGEVILLSNSGRLTGSTSTTVTAKRLEIAGKLLGTAKLRATLTPGGSLKIAFADESASVRYKKTAVTDPPLAVEKGVVRGGAKVIAE